MPQAVFRLSVVSFIILWLVLLWYTYQLNAPSSLERFGTFRERSISKTSLEAQDHEARETSITPVQGYNLPKDFYFWGEWPNDNGNSKNMVLNSFVSAMELIEIALKAMSGTDSNGQSLGANDPSFQRYWNSGDFYHVQVILGRLMAALGAPGEYEVIRQCQPIDDGIQLIYGDGPKVDNSGKRDQCAISNTIAYYATYLYPGPQPVKFYIAFCPLFFYIYKLPVKLDALPGIPYVNDQWIGSSIDSTDLTRTSEVTSGASVVIHELLHAPKLFIGVNTERKDILDLIVTRPDDEQTKIAYRAFYSMKVKDQAWQARSKDDGQTFQNPQRYNVDNYVYTVLEIFYRIKFNRQSWQDPPDPKLPGAPAVSRLAE